MSLEVKEITFQYERTEPIVLKDFSASFEREMITAVLGPNGVGKTTLSKLIMGILHPQQGSICLDGENLKDWSLAQRGKKIGYVMQNPARQLFSATVKEEVEFGLKNLGLNEDQAYEKGRCFLALFDLEQYEGRFPFSLSHGEKQRLVLASVLAMEPEYLLLDEPTSGLDQKRKQQLGLYLEQVCTGQNCGVIVITHDLNFARQFAGRHLTIGG